MPWMILALAATVALSCRGDLPTLMPPSEVSAKPPIPSAQLSQVQVPATRAKRRPKPEMVGVLNLNRATEAELRLLPGIGKGRAQSIVERRSKRPFESLEEVSRIRGLKGVVRRLRSHLTLTGDTTLRAAPRPPRGEQIAAAGVGSPAG